MLTHSLFIATLLLGPPVDAAGPTEPNAETYQMLLGEIARLNSLINEGEEVGDDLDATIKQLSTQAPLLAADEVGQRVRTTALLNLARARLLADQSSEAEAAMDAAIRLAHDDDLHVGDYGPVLEAFHDQRLATIAEMGTGSLQVVCTLPCSVYVDEQPASPGVTELALGTHRIWIEPSDPESTLAHEIQSISLDSPGAIARVNYSPKRPAPPRPPESPARPKRLMPAAGEGAMIFIGASLIVAGAITMISETPNGLAIGASLAGIGGATAITGGALLGIDQAAQRGHAPVARSKSKAALMVGWTFRF